ncbi:MAG: hypothetical protein ACKVP3_23665 [Hyphomicrobiaceae bacterium]
MALFGWSTTAGDNDDADANINLREGQAPSTLNNAGRAIMAAIKVWFNDISGNLVTGGTSTAYTLTTGQGFTSAIDGVYVKARMNATSGAAPTLEVDDIDPKAIQAASGTAIPNGALLNGGVYTFAYDSSADAWIVGDRFGDQLTSAGNPDLVAIEALAGTNGVARKTAANTWALDEGVTVIPFVANNNGTVFNTGILGEIEVPFACTITGVALLADQTGSIVVDIWKDSYANYPPTDADSITAAAPPTISNSIKSVDTTLTGWTTAVAAGDILRFNIDSVTSITRFTLSLRVKRFI